MNLYVGNLSYGMNDDDLVFMFQEFGELASASIITDRETGRSKGFAFVEYKTREAGELAMQELAGAKVDGRDITINEARERPAKPAGAGRPPRGGPGGGNNNQ